MNTKTKSEQRRSRFFGLLVVIFGIGAAGYLLVDLRSSRKQRQIHVGFVDLRIALSGKSGHFSSAKTAFLRASRYTLWDPEPMIYLSITERIEASSPLRRPSTLPTVISDIEREKLAYRLLRGNRLSDARRVLKRIRNSEKRMFLLGFIARLE